MCAMPIPGACAATSSQPTPSSRREAPENRFAFGEGTGQLEILRKVRETLRSGGGWRYAPAAHRPHRDQKHLARKGTHHPKTVRCRRESDGWS